MITITAADHIERAKSALVDSGVITPPSQHSLGHADVQAAIATAIAHDAIATALDRIAAAIAHPGAPAQQEWPERVTARLLTRVGLLMRDPTATVDIVDDPADVPYCTVTQGHPLAYRDRTVSWAREHADACTALPQPAA